MEKKRNFWPQGIIIAILLMIGACGYTVKFALDNPVQMDSSYMEKYQQVDENINEILKAQKVFDSKYIITLEKNRLKIGKNELSLKIVDKNTNQSITDAKIELLVTRPDSEEFDIKPNTKELEGGIYSFDEIDIQKIGRWQIIAKISIKNDLGYFKDELLATN